MSNIEVTLKEVEVSKLSLQPGEILVVKMRGEEFSDQEVLQSFQNSLTGLIKNNKILVLGIPDGHSIDFEKLSAAPAIPEVKVESPCSVPMSYCMDCACGKKEAVLEQIKKENVND